MVKNLILWHRTLILQVLTHTHFEIKLPYTHYILLPQIFIVFPHLLGRFWFLCLMAYQVCRLFNVKAILLEQQWWYYLIHSWEDKGVHIFPNSICPKVNVIKQLEFELAYYDFAVHRFNHYTTWTLR